MLGELNESQMNNLLSSQVIGRIAYSNGKELYILPVTYFFDGKNIYGQSRKGTKLEIMRKNPNVCFLVDVVLNMANWQSVMLHGTFKELKGKEAEKARINLFDKIFPLTTSSTIHPHEHKVTAGLDDTNRIKPVMYQIRVKQKTGRFEKL